MWFSKGKETNCKEGAICAWEFNGSLYRTKEARDRAEESCIRRAMIDRIKVILLQHQNYSGDFDFNYRHDRNKPNVSGVAEALFHNWKELRYLIDEVVSKKTSG